MLLVAVVALAASIAGIANEFAQDDLHLIQDNVRIQDLANLREIVASPFWPPPYSQDLYRPVTALLLAFEFTLGAGAPLAFRVVSYLLYAAVSVLVYSLARRLLSPPVALVVALLFAAHPVHVEAVALGVGQAELVVAGLAVLSVKLYVEARRAGSVTWGRWGLLASLSFIAALTKEQGFVIPMLLLSAEVVLDGSGWNRIRSLAPGYSLVAVAAAVALAVRFAVLGELSGTFTSEALLGVGVRYRILTMLAIVPQWVRLLLWPAHLQGDYSPQELVASHAIGFRELAGAALILLVLVLAWISRRRAPVVTLGVLWCAVALAPVSNVIAPTAILLEERTLMLPSIGAMLMLGGLVQRGIDVWPRIATQARTELKWAVVLLVVAGVLRSAERQRVWRNDAFFAVRTVQDAPCSFRAQRSYGEVLFALGEPALARQAYDSAIALTPRGVKWRTRNDLARNYRALGQTVAESEQLRSSLDEQPRQDDTRGLLIASYLLQGRYADAAREADSAVVYGGKREVFAGMHALADSAARVGAPPGSIRIGITLGGFRPARS